MSYAEGTEGSAERRVTWRTCWDQGKDACQTFPFFFFSIQGRWFNGASTCACRRDHHACAWAAFAAWPASMCRSSPVQRPALVPRVVPGGQKGTGPFQPLRGQDGTLFVVFTLISDPVLCDLIVSDWDSYFISQISEEIKLCEAGECSYLRPQRRNVLRNFLVSDAIMQWVRSDTKCLEWRMNWF